MQKGSYLMTEYVYTKEVSSCIIILTYLARDHADNSQDRVCLYN